MQDDKELEDLIELLDNFAKSETGRLKVSVSEELEAGTVERKYHHGRCDINSPWACGAAFDVLEPEENTQKFGI